MFQYKTCGICGLSVINPNFLKDKETGEPKYFADKRFYPGLDDDIIFCSAQHSAEWHKNNFDKYKPIK